jgi:putative DNA-binding protein
MISDLTNLQTLLYKAITVSPGGVTETPERRIGNGLESMIRGDGRLSAVERITIYADAYFYRLLDCLKEDFPATLAVVGQSTFEDIVRPYLTEYPPTEPSILFAGRDLADFLAIRHLSDRWPFLAELALLERTLIEVFHAPDAPALSASQVHEIAPADWPTLSLRTHPALRMLDCEWRVNDVLGAVETATQWTEPEPGPVFLLVWRQGAQVYYRELEPPERAPLEVASRGANFATVCEALASWLDAEDATAAITELLARWLADGLLVCS